MNTLLVAKQQVAQLSKEDFLLFRDWFYTFDNQLWDKKIENDIQNHKIDDLANKALSEFNQNKATKF